MQNFCVLVFEYLNHSKVRHVKSWYCEGLNNPTDVFPNRIQTIFQKIEKYIFYRAIMGVVLIVSGISLKIYQLQDPLKILCWHICVLLLTCLFALCFLALLYLSSVIRLFPYLRNLYWVSFPQNKVIDYEVLIFDKPVGECKPWTL